MKNKRILSLILSLMIIVSVFGVFTNAVNAQEMKLSENEIQVTAKGKITIEVDLGAQINLDKLEWTLDGKPLNQWKSFDNNTEDYTGSPWIKISEVLAEGTVLKATLENDLPYGVESTDRRPYPRWTFENLMGTYPLTVRDTISGKTATALIKINNYEGFHHYDEIKPALDEIIAAGNLKNNRYFEYQSVGKSVEGRDLHLVTVAKNKEIINKYLNETNKMAVNNPKELINMIKGGNLKDYQVPIFINNIHPDESPGVDAQIAFLRKLISEDTLEFKTDKEGSLASINVDDILDNFILMFEITQNPDGKHHNTRENANKFDLNRDNIFQTQPESRALTTLVAKYNPISFIDLHGFVKAFLIEPATAPHEQNYEYDLLMGGPRDTKKTDLVGDSPGSIGNARNMGKIAIANTKYEGYIIPLFDYKQGWDDDFLGYTPMYAMIHGALGHTVEVPDQNLESRKAFEYVIIGHIDYLLKNKDQLYLNQLEVFRRGIDNEDNRNVDSWHVDLQGNVLGRQRNGNENFFPDYYIIPVDSANQKNILEAYNMVNFFLRNDVKVYKTNSEVKYNSLSYPKGTIIVPLNQAKRSLANAALYTGYDESNWQEMYAEVVLNYPALRGFDSIEVRSKGIFNGKIDEIKSEVDKPESILITTGEKVIVKNSNNDAIKLVNRLLSKNLPVSIVTSKVSDVMAGDYVVNTNDLKNNIHGLYIESMSIENLEGLSTSEIVEPKIYLTPSGSNYASPTDATRFVLKELGFKLVDSAQAANTIVDASGNVKKEEVANKTYIGIGGRAITALKDKDIYPLTTKESNDNLDGEGLLNVVNDINSPIFGRYSEDDISYVKSGTVIESGRPEAKVLSKVVDADNYYIQGWWPGHEVAKGKTLAISDNFNDTNFVLFASDITNKAHTGYLFRQLSGSIYLNNSKVDTSIPGPKPVPPVDNKPGDNADENVSSPFPSGYALPNVIEVITGKPIYVFKIGSDEFLEILDNVTKTIKMDTTVFIRENRTMLPLRYVAQVLKAEVNWDEATRTATFTKDGKTASIQVDGNIIKMNDGTEIEMDAKPVLKDNRTFVSITNVAKVFNLTHGDIKDGIHQNIEWNETDRSVIISVDK